MNIPKLALNTNNALPGLKIPQLAIPSLNPGLGKSRNDRVSSPIIASTPVNELMNVEILYLDRSSSRKSSRNSKEG